MKILLISTYDLGHQPFGVASPAAWLTKQGHQVECADLSLESLPIAAVQTAGLIALYLPMHTATRLAAQSIPTIRQLNPKAHLCCYGLYAPLNEKYLRKLGVETILGGEFEPGLVSLAERLPVRGQTESLISLDRLQFQIPLRTGLPPIEKYSALQIAGETKPAGYTESSRGCKHRCRHCPVVPVYQGIFRVVQPEIVLADIRQQVDAGAQHITFGDPDFFNGPAHAIKIVEALHREWPTLSYDATIKIEHLLKHRDLLPKLRDTGCVFVTSAVESVDDAVLAKLQKGHTRADFIEAAHLFRAIGLTLAPTFIPFTPWTTRKSYREMLDVLADLDLVENVASLQLALRLLIPSGSRMLELAGVQAVIGDFDEPALLYRWRHSDPEMDELAAKAMRIAQSYGSRREIFGQLWNLVSERPYEDFNLLPRTAIPYLDEPWFC